MKLMRLEEFAKKIEFIIKKEKNVFMETQNFQNKIYRKMSPEKKVKIAAQLFLLGKKLHRLGEQKHETKGFQGIRTGRTSL